jgi:hypothetical protein
MNTQGSIPIPRNRVFVLIDGTFVVQWEDHQVQNLLNGKYRSFTEDYFGSEITDYELNQLKNAGVVERYDSELVYVYASPDIAPRTPGRSYYLNTTRPKDELEDIQAALVAEHLLDRFSVRLRDDFVVIWSQNGVAFRRFDDAEKARELLAKRMPELFKETVVAFIEILSIY